MSKLSEQEKERRYDLERGSVKPEESDLCKAARWLDSLEDERITLAREADTLLNANEDDDITALLEEFEEFEDKPVPPVPAGYATDRAFIYKQYGESFCSIDRRDGGMLLCDKGEVESTLIEADMTLALFRFFREQPIEELMIYLWREQIRRTGGKEMNELIDIITA